MLRYDPLTFDYTNHLAKTPLDDAFAGQKWTRPN